MITLRWSHIMVGLALIIGLFIGSHLQLSPSVAQAQTSDTLTPMMVMPTFAADSIQPVALTVYNNEVYVVRGNNLYIFKPVENRFVKGYKIPVLIGKAPIEAVSSATTTVQTRAPLRPSAPARPTPGLGVAEPGIVR